MQSEACGRTPGTLVDTEEALAATAWMNVVSHENVPTTKAGRRPNRTCAEMAPVSISQGTEETLNQHTGHEENAIVTAPD